MVKKKKKMYHVFGHGIRSQILELYHHLFFFLDNSMVRGRGGPGQGRDGQPPQASPQN